MRIVQYDEALAADVFQEAMMNIWKNAEAYSREKGRLFTWMANICRNKAIDKLRQLNRSREIQTSESNVTQFEERQVVHNNIDVIGLRKEVEKLPKEQRELIELNYFGGFTHAEIAERTEVPLGTVKTRIRNGLKQLRTVYKQ